jgi:hypothetical protein
MQSPTMMGGQSIDPPESLGDKNRSWPHGRECLARMRSDWPMHFRRCGAAAMADGKILTGTVAVFRSLRNEPRGRKPHTDGPGLP